jgi:hypothetical protein
VLAVKVQLKGTRVDKSLEEKGVPKVEAGIINVELARTENKR